MRKTIEERATLDADKYVGENGNFGAWQSHRLAYIRVATEQDKISRQEERERCIRLATKVYADLLSASGYDIGSINSELQRLRKAIEKGGNNGTES